MKKSINAWAATAAVAIAFIFGILLSYWELNNQRQRLNAFIQYYNHTEQLLDDINNKWSWVDAFDPQEYYEWRREVILRNPYSINK